MHHLQAIEQSKQIDPIIRHHPLNKIDETPHLRSNRQPPRRHPRQHQTILRNGSILTLNEPIKSIICLTVIDKTTPLTCKKQSIRNERQIHDEQ